MGKINCTKCGATLLDAAFNTGELAPCPSCGVPLRIDIFPALFRKIEDGKTGTTILESAEASCFYHPQKQAAVMCDGCGRFLCELCDLEVNGRHLCPGCLASEKKKGKLRDLERERVLYANVALALAIVPILLWPFTLLGGPAALFITIRYWRSPSSLVSGNKARFVIAFLLGLVETLGWLFLFGYLIFTHR